LTVSHFTHCQYLGRSHIWADNLEIADFI